MLTVPTDVLYQFDDGGNTGPHFYSWRGTTAHGETKGQAKLALGLMIGGALLDWETMESLL